MCKDALIKDGIWLENKICENGKRKSPLVKLINLSAIAAMPVHIQHPLR
jgi:hypothetical protein